MSLPVPDSSSTDDSRRPAPRKAVIAVAAAVMVTLAVAFVLGGRNKPKPPPLPPERERDTEFTDPNPALALIDERWQEQTAPEMNEPDGAPPGSPPGSPPAPAPAAPPVTETPSVSVSSPPMAAQNAAATDPLSAPTDSSSATVAAAPSSSAALTPATPRVVADNSPPVTAAAPPSSSAAPTPASSGHLADNSPPAAVASSARPSGDNGAPQPGAHPDVEGFSLPPIATAARTPTDTARPAPPSGNAATPTPAGTPSAPATPPVVVAAPAKAPHRRNGPPDDRSDPAPSAVPVAASSPGKTATSAVSSGNSPLSSNPARANDTSAPPHGADAETISRTGASAPTTPPAPAEPVPLPEFRRPRKSKGAVVLQSATLVTRAQMPGRPTSGPPRPREEPVTATLAEATAYAASLTKTLRQSGDLTPAQIVRLPRMAETSSTAVWHSDDTPAAPAEVRPFGLVIEETDPEILAQIPPPEPPAAPPSHTPDGIPLRTDVPPGASPLEKQGPLRPAWTRPAGE